MNSPKKVKSVPYSKEAEMMVLGCMLTSINSLNIAAEMLQETDFYFSEHKIIFSCMKAAFSLDKPADDHLVAEELKRQEKLQDVGGVNYLVELAEYAATSAYIEEYIDNVLSLATLRKMISAAKEIEKTAYEQPTDVHQALDEAQQLLFRIGQSNNSRAGLHIKDVLQGRFSEKKIPFLKLLENRQERFLQLGEGEPSITGIPTHFLDLDRLINGLTNSHLMILAARPAMGKTALALNIAENVCFKSKVPVGIFSLEMTAEQLVGRIVCSQANVEGDKIKTGSLSPEEFQHVVEAVKNIEQFNMVIDDQPGLKITDLRARARRMKESHGIGFIIIDYLQLITGSSFFKNAENRQLEISEISRTLKNLARELDIPVLCIAQLSRRVEERAGHRPMMSDLRESGCLTGDTLIQDARTGTLHTIKELADRKDQTPIFVNAVDSKFSISQRTLLKAFHSGKKRVFELKTRTGRSIRASANHPFLKLEGWTRLDQLKTGDRIATPRKISLTAPTSSMSDEELILLAHLLGDGCILPKQPYHYTSADEDNIKVVAHTAQSLFGVQPKIVKQKNWYHVYLPTPIRLTHNKHHPITTWLDTLGLDRVHSYEKRCPKALFECSDDKIALFLRHLWATDGNISIKKLKGRKQSGAIYYGSSSKLLSQQVQHLLLRCGIQSTLRIVPSSRGYRSMYHVSIQGVANQKLFLSKIGAHGKRGAISSTLLTLLKQIEPNPNNDVIPKEAWKTVIQEAKEVRGLSWRHIAKELGTSYSGSSLFRTGISRTRMSALHQILDSDKVMHLAQSDVYWDEVLSIEEMGMEDVYDATVDNLHNFIANDILVHNSIEQDADIVMFLLRREYYDPHDRPGQAELIIAKNRHGAIGSVNFTYRKELAQFANFSMSAYQVPMNQDTSDAFKPFQPSIYSE